MRKEETNRYVGAPGGLADLASAANNGRGPLDIARAGSGRTANSAATGASAMVGLVATNPRTFCVSGGQHEEIAIWPHSPCIAAQHAIGVAVFASPKAHRTNETTASARISSPARDRTVLLKHLGIERIHCRPRVKSMSKPLTLASPFEASIGLRKSWSWSCVSRTGTTWRLQRSDISPRNTSTARAALSRNTVDGSMTNRRGGSSHTCAIRASMSAACAADSVRSGFCWL